MGPYEFSDYGTNGQALETFGFEAYCNVDGVALQTFGLLFPYAGIWNPCATVTSTTWASCAGITTTTWNLVVGTTLTTWT